MTVYSNLRVSVLIPCRNEERFIGKCLDSVISQIFPKNKLEILVIDGLSEDKTKEIINQYAKKYPFIRMYENIDKSAPFALNIGVKNSKGDVLIRMDAHSTYDNEYITKCVKYLEDYKADNVGGIWKIIPRENNLIGNAIAIVQSHPFGVGNAEYRFISQKPKWVDTVPYFCCNKDVFDKVGLFNENLTRGQDMEFNIRLKKAGGKILLAPDIISYYYVRSDLRSFLKHNFKNGMWAILPFKYTDIMPVSIRHLIPLFFVAAFICSFLLFAPAFFIIFGSYIILDIYYSLLISSNKGMKYFVILPVMFFLLHFSYGLGSVWGLISLFNKKHK